MEKDITFDYVLNNVVGAAGKYQWSRYVLPLFVLELSAGMPNFLIFFSGYVPKHRCLIPACESDPPQFNSTAWAEFALPSPDQEDGALAKKGKFDECRMYDMLDVSGDCVASNFNASNITTCDSFVYDRTFFVETVASKLDLVCGSQHYKQLLITLLMLGLLFGSFFGGLLSDHIGRKRTLYVGQLMTVVAVFAAAFVNDYSSYAALHFIYCAMCPVLWITNQTICLELFSNEYKKMLLATKTFQWSMAQVVLTIAAYFIRDWVYLQIFVAMMGVLGLLTWPFVPESPRWLAQNGKKEEALKLLLKIADTNGKKLSPENITLVDNFLQKIDDGTTKEERKRATSILELFQPKFRLTFAILTCCWIMANVGSYTLSLSAATLSGDFFLNYALTFTMSLFISVFLWLVLWFRVGRKAILAGTGLTVGICCLTLAFIPKDLTNPILIIFLIGTFAVGANFNLCWFLSPDFYPTNLRSQATGVTSTIARIFGLIIPFISDLGDIWSGLPMVVLGSPFLLLTLLIIFFLPEITDKELPQTTRDAFALHERDRKVSTISTNSQTPINNVQ